MYAYMSACIYVYMYDVGRHVYMYVHPCISYMHAYIQVYVYIQVYISIHTYIHTYRCVYTYFSVICVDVLKHICLCISTYTHVCMYVLCLCIYIHTYIHVSTYMYKWMQTYTGSCVSANIPT